jgi:hypothetical protein
MSPSELDIAVNKVVEYLRRENAVRISVDEVGNYRTRYDICDAAGVCVDNWTKVKTRMLQRGISICYKPGSGLGHYLGYKGEEVVNVVYKYKVAQGWVKHLEETKEAIQSSSPEAKEWIDRRFKNLELEESYA